MAYFDRQLPDKWRWFPQARYGLFIHWGPYSAYGRGEQVLFREHLDHQEYQQRACAWNPRHFDADLCALTPVNWTPRL
jgi:alpha-L-fucosidase